MKPMPNSARPSARFGFDQVMRRPVHGRFRAWYDRNSLLAEAHAEAASVFSSPDRA